MPQSRRFIRTCPSTGGRVKGKVNGVNTADGFKRKVRKSLSKNKDKRLDVAWLPNERHKKRGGKNARLNK